MLQQDIDFKQDLWKSEIDFANFCWFDINLPCGHEFRPLLHPPPVLWFRFFTSYAFTPHSFSKEIVCLSRDYSACCWDAPVHLGHYKSFIFYCRSIKAIAVNEKTGFVELTARGREMIRLPVQPMLAHMILESLELDLLPEMAAVCACIHIGSLFMHHLEDEVGHVWVVKLMLLMHWLRCTSFLSIIWLKECCRHYISCNVKSTSVTSMLSALRLPYGTSDPHVSVELPKCVLAEGSCCFAGHERTLLQYMNSRPIAEKFRTNWRGGNGGRTYRADQRGFERRADRLIKFKWTSSW